MDQHENRFHDHEMANVQLKWPEQERNKINKLVDSVMSHMNSGIESSATRPELAALCLLTTPTEWPEEPAALAICGEEEVRLVHFRPVLETVECDTDAVQQQEWPTFKVYAKRLREISTKDLIQRVLTNPDLMKHFPNLSHIL